MSQEILEQQQHQEPDARPPKVVFDEAQQAKVNELIKDAMSRAGRDARAEAARLKIELEESSAELSRLRGSSADAQAVKEQGLTLGKEGLLLSLAGKYNFVKGEQLAKLIGDRVAFDESSKRYVVKNPDGTTATDATGNPLAVEALVSAFASENPHLVRGDVKPGVGSTENRQWSGELTESQTLSKYFGRGSNARLANELAMKNPNEYRRLRALAQRQGLIR